MKWVDKLKKNWRWILSIILLIFILTSIPSFSGFFAFLGLLLIVPIPKWQAFVEKYVKGKLRSIGAGILAVLALLTYPSSPDTPAPEVTEPSISVVSESTEPVHIHDFADATCLQAKTCRNCGETEGEALGHQWVDATCLRPKNCSVCNAAEGSLGAHNWVEASCLAPQTCSVCETTVGEVSDHTWQEATCTAPKTCSVCNLTEGDPIAHAWVEATCLTPKTCSYCKTKEGELGSHSWEDATCMAPKTCTVCNEKEGARVDCKYSNHICVYCGDEEATVWIPNSGSKYHSNSSCSRMKNPSEVYISSAIAWGYGRCSKCY